VHGKEEVTGDRVLRQPERELQVLVMSVE